MKECGTLSCFHTTTRPVVSLERSTRYEHEAGAKCSVASPSSRGKIRSLRRVT